jgi:hypothetical protein
MNGTDTLFTSKGYARSERKMTSNGKTQSFNRMLSDPDVILFFILYVAIYPSCSVKDFMCRGGQREKDVIQAGLDGVKKIISFFDYITEVASCTGLFRALLTKSLTIIVSFIIVGKFP